MWVLIPSYGTRAAVFPLVEGGHKDTSLVYVHVEVFPYKSVTCREEADCRQTEKQHIS